MYPPVMIPSLLLLFSFISCFATILSIKAENIDYLPYQPIYINAYYEGDKKVSLSPGAEEIKIHVRYNPTGAETEFRSMVHIDKLCADCLKSKLPTAIEYKESTIMNITSDARGWLFEIPGEYSVWISLLDGGMVSNIIGIKVVMPKGEDIVAAEAIKKCPGFSTFMYMEGGDMFNMALATAEKLAEGNSGYAVFMRDLLVKNYSQQSCSSEGIVRLADMKKVKKYYDSVTPIEKSNSKVRTLILIGRFAKSAQDSNEAEFVKAEYRKLKSSVVSMDFENYIHKKLVE